MDGKTYHMDKWEKAGNENDATSDNEKVPNITRGKPGFSQRRILDPPPHPPSKSVQNSNSIY